MFCQLWAVLSDTNIINMCTVKFALTITNINEYVSESSISPFCSWSNEV